MSTSQPTNARQTYSLAGSLATIGTVIAGVGIAVALSRPTDHVAKTNKEIERLQERADLELELKLTELRPQIEEEKKAIEELGEEIQQGLRKRLLLLQREQLFAAQAELGLPRTTAVSEETRVKLIEQASEKRLKALQHSENILKRLQKSPGMYTNPFVK